jgi:predicted ATPase/DNA-binding SARP family transcriptional activator
MGQLSIVSLGTLQMRLDTTPLTDFDSDKARALLTYLAVESDRAHHREHLAGLFWPESPERRARHTLSQALYNVRTVIGDRHADADSQFLDVTPQTLRLRPESQYWVDADVLATCQDDLHRCDEHNTLEKLEDAIALYHGPFLTGFSLGNSPAFEEWTLLQRERLARLAMEILGALVEGYCHHGAYDEALHCAWRQLDLDPWREDAHRQVIRLLALNGQHAAALAQYEQCCQVLQRELHTAPDAETMDLVERIKTGALAAPTPAQPAPPRPSLPTHHNLPTFLTPIVGRGPELADLQARLRDPNCRLLTLTGPGGIGKTRLAVALARKRRDDFPDGVFLVPLTPLADPEALIPAIAGAIGLTFSDRGGSQAQQLHRYLRDRTLLLILDGAEHLLDMPTTTQVMTGILGTAPDVKLLVTSRIRLNLLGEHLFTVGTLAYPAESTEMLDALTTFPAVQLFLRSAHRVCPSFKLTESNADAVATLCRKVQGHPLAILLAASWTATLAVEEIVTALTDETSDIAKGRLDLLQTDWRNVPLRHRSLRAVFDRSWQLLSSRERMVFQACAVFQGGFTRAAAHRILQATPQDLRALVNASMISRTSSGRYALHDLLDDYATHKLKRDPTVWHNVHARHCEYYADVLERWAEEAKGPRQQAALEEMDVEIDNARAAWDWAVAQGDLDVIDRAIQGLGLYYRRRVRRQEGSTACQVAVDRLEAQRAAEPLDKNENMRVLSKVLNWHSRFLPPEPALAAARRSLAILEEPKLVGQDVRAEQAAALRQLGHLMMRSDRAEAEQCYRQSLSLYQNLGAEWEQAQILGDLGWCAWHVSQFDKARVYQEKSLTLAQSLGDLRAISNAIKGLSGVAMAFGRFQKAARLSEKCLALRRELGDPLEIAGALYSLAMKRMMLAQISEATALLQACIKIKCGHFNLPGGLERSVLGWANTFAGNHEEATVHAEAALEIMRTQKSSRGLGWTQYVMGMIRLAQGNLEEAKRRLQTSVIAYRPLEQRMEMANALAILGYSRCLSGQFDQAWCDLAESLRIGRRVQAFPPLFSGVAGFALLHALKGNAERAIELYEVASKMPLVEKSQWFREVIGQYIEAAAADLRSDVVAAARERGRQRDLQETVEELLEMLTQAE